MASKRIRRSVNGINQALASLKKETIQTLRSLTKQQDWIEFDLVMDELEKIDEDDYVERLVDGDDLVSLMYTARRTLDEKEWVSSSRFMGWCKGNMELLKMIGKVSKTKDTPETIRARLLESSWFKSL